MQLISDALVVLGSRIGIGWDPNNRTSYLLRHDKHPGISIDIKAGIVLKDRTIVFPLSKDGHTFSFMDQETTPTSMKLTGIDHQSGLQAKLSAYIPFRPRDEAFSTIPVILMELEIKRLPSNFRWKKQTDEIVSGDLYLEINGEHFSFSNNTEDLDVSYTTHIRRVGEVEGKYELLEKACRDRLVILEGKKEGTRILQPFSLDKGMNGRKISIAWCTYDEPALEVLGEICPFKYTQHFSNIDDVVKWTKANADTIKDNSHKVDDILQGHNLGTTVNHLMAQSLHSWLMNTWWVVRPCGQDWFTVWEGTCYYQSTVDVEYTQSPFYLTVWPEILELQLNQWPLFGKVAENNRRFLSHDFGWFTRSSHQYYHHDMEVEENANYILMCYAHWRRTARDSVIKSHSNFVKMLMDFIVSCDTTGNGIPDFGCANTIDDATAAVQYGKEQVYLGVKAMAACVAGIEILKYTGEVNVDKYIQFTEKARETLEANGWSEDHYVVTLSKTMEAVDPWTGKIEEKELNGWDAYHIYTSNGLVLLNMVGLVTGLSNDRLKKDIRNSTAKTLGRYGSRHSSYIDHGSKEIFKPGMVASAPKVGWISMNMLRDIAAAYQGIDLFSLSDRYWDWQTTVNSQDFTMFFETYYGNNLHFYPRGIAVFGFVDAAAGLSYDAVSNEKHINPVRGSLQLPLYLFADWKKGTVPMIITELEDGSIKFRETAQQNI